MAGLAFGSAYAWLLYFSIGWLGQAQPRLAARFEIGWQPHYPDTLLFLTLCAVSPPVFYICSILLCGVPPSVFEFCAVSPPKFEHLTTISCAVSPPQFWVICGVMCSNICFLILCGVPTPLRSSGQITISWMCGATPLTPEHETLLSAPPLFIWSV